MPKINEATTVIGGLLRECDIINSFLYFRLAALNIMDILKRKQIIYLSIVFGTSCLV